MHLNLVIATATATADLLATTIAPSATLLPGAQPDKASKRAIKRAR